MKGSIFGLKLPPKPLYANDSLKIIPLGGVGEIGMNCMVWETNNTMVMVDCGLMFPSDYHLGVDVIIPDFTYIKENSAKLDAIILTHGHEDHIGALPWLVPYINNVPIYGTEFTLALVEHKLKERNLLNRCPLVLISPNQYLKLGDMDFTFIPVCHSIIEGVAVCADTPVGKIVHTGDFKIDQNPLSGPTTDLKTFEKFAGDQGVTLLLSDSTNVENEGVGVTEREVFESLKHIFSEINGRIIVALFASHIQRIQEVFDCAKEAGRFVVVCGRSLKNNIEMAKNLGKLKITTDVFYDGEQRPSLADNEQVLLVTGSQGEPLSALSRIVNGNHKSLSLHAGDVVILSSRTIPGNTMAVTTLINNVYKVGAEVYHDKEYLVHASGHGGKNDLAAMIKAVRPKYFVPVHGEYRHLVKHSRLAALCGVSYQNSRIIVDGTPFIINNKDAFLGDPIQAGAVMVDGKGVGDVGQTILKERHLLGGEGLVIVVMVLDAGDWSILHGPQVLSKGFAFEPQFNHLLQDSQCLVLEVLEKFSAKDDIIKLQEQIRITLRQFFRKVIDRNPIVVPIITEI